MSLVNQMLQDLEHRRTDEVGVSPLGGLSASGGVVARAQSINYLLLGVTVLLAVVVVLALIYLFGVKQTAVLEIASAVKSSAVHQQVVQPIAQAAVVPSVESMPKPVIQQVVGEVKPGLENNIRPVETPIKGEVKKIKTAMPRPVSTDVVGNEVGLISIQKSATKNKSVQANINGADTPESVADSDSVNGTSNNSVNKTIHPLTREQQAQIAFQDAVKMLGRGDELGAKEMLEKALSIEPVHVRARETLSALLLNTGRVSEAAEKLDEGLRLRPSSTPLAKLYARVLVDQGDNDAAVSVLERARPLVAADPDYYALLAMLYREVGKHAQSSQVYQQILQVRPGVAVWWMGLALAEDAMSAPIKALEAYQRAQRAGGLNAEVSQYVQSRIVALTPSVSEKSLQAATDDVDGFED